MSDIFVEIDFPMDHPEKFVMRTNIKDHLVKDFLVDWVLRGEMGKGTDARKASQRKVYHIRITCDMSYDDIRIKHDCGNDGLMTGILMDVIGRMPEGGA